MGSYTTFFRYIHIRLVGASNVSSEKVKGGEMGRVELGGKGCMLCCVFVMEIRPNVH